jgi:3-dehydroquinate synthase
MIFGEKPFKVRVAAEKDKYYPVIFGKGIDSTFSQIAADIIGDGREVRKDYSNVAIITDSNVKSLYESTLKQKLKARGISALTLEIPAGEQSKSFLMANKLIEELLENKFDRKSLLIALGGGVVGDLTGTVAMLLHRGVDYIQVPTTLLSQVDSSIGFKVAVNTPQGKNVVGGFYPPTAVYSDSFSLVTLPQVQYNSGLGEVIKMAVSSDRKLFELIRKNILMGSLNSKSIKENRDLARRCCDIKRKIVEIDPREENSFSTRAVLNLGHTIGHALEVLSNYSDSALHGEMVSVGIVGAARISYNRDILSEKGFRDIESLLSSADLSTRIPSILAKHSNQEIIDLMKLDKKSEAGIIYMVLPADIGRIHREEARYKVEVKEEEVSRAFDYLRN